MPSSFSPFLVSAAQAGANGAGEVVGRNLRVPILDAVQDLPDHIGGIRRGDGSLTYVIL